MLLGVVSSVHYLQACKDESLEEEGWNLRLQSMSEVKSVSVSCSFVSDSVRPRELWPARFLCPWDSPGKNAEVGSQALL